MPNFDGNGPLKRGRMIGRGRGPCPQCNEEGRLHPCKAESGIRDNHKSDRSSGGGTPCQNPSSV